MAAPSLASLGHTVAEKLNRENFLVWRAQVLLHVKAAGMMGYLDSSIKEPPAVILLEKEVAGKKETSAAPNPEHVVWVMQDQQSCARIIQLRSQIGSTRKGDLSAVVYFTKMKGLADELAAVGKPPEEDDVVSHILQGLMHEPEYNGFVSAISACTITDQPIGLGELFSLLLAAEARITAQTAAYSANLAAKGGGRGGYGRPGNSGNGGSRGGYNNNHNGARSFDNSVGGFDGRQGGDHGGDRGGDRSDRSGDRGGSLEKCQICKESGHGVWRCRKHYDRCYNNNVRNPTGGGGGGGQRSANAAAHSYGVDTNWYLDTGATDHVTGELEKLAVRDKYTGTEQIHTASGQGSGHSENHSSKQE